MKLGNLIDFSSNSSVSASVISQEAWILDLEDIEKDSGKLLCKKRKSQTSIKSDKHTFKRGNVLYSKLRPYLNKVIVADEDGYCTSEILAFDFGEILNRFAQLYLMSPFFVEYAMSDAYGVKMPRLGSRQGNEAFMPIPPIQEQQRIVEQMDILNPFIQRYDENEATIARLNDNLKADLRKSILQEAIQGRLVPQDPNDEPASALLERIREEKARLIKEKKIKRDKTESVIFKGDDNCYFEKLADGTVHPIETPFDIPVSWVWIRLSHIASVYGGKRIPAGKKLTRENTGYKYIRVADMKNSSVKTNDLHYVPLDVIEAIRKYTITKDDLYITVAGTIGSVGIIPEELDGANLTENANKIVFTIINKEWLLYTLQSPFVQSLILKVTTKVGQPKLAISRIENLLLPLPPLPEQYRIVQCIKNLERFLR